MIDLKKISSILSKALAWNSKPTEQSFPELPEVLVWFRCFIAIIYGTYLGRSGATSPTFLLQAFNLLAFLPIMYSRLYLGVPGEEFGAKIIFSGLINAGALALLLWIYWFTAMHEAEEGELRTLLATAVSSASSAGSGEADSSATGDVPYTEPESEF